MADIMIYRPEYFTLASPRYSSESMINRYSVYLVIAFNLMVLQLVHGQDMDFRLGVNVTAKYLSHSISQLLLGERDQFIDYVGKGVRMVGESVGVLAEHPEVLGLLAVSWMGLVGKKLRTRKKDS